MNIVCAECNISKSKEDYRPSCQEVCRECRCHFDRISYKARYKRKADDGRVKELRQWYAKRSEHQLIRRRAFSKKNLARTPRWVAYEERMLIIALYAEAHRMSKESNIKYHVDHIEPLNGRNVSGLHCLANLRIMTAKENMEKGNRRHCNEDG